MRVKIRSFMPLVAIAVIGLVFLSFLIVFSIPSANIDHFKKDVIYFCDSAQKIGMDSVINRDVGLTYSDAMSSLITEGSDTIVQGHLKIFDKKYPLITVIKEAYSWEGEVTSYGDKVMARCMETIYTN